MSTDSLKREETILNNNKTYLVPKITYQTYLNLIY